MAKRFTDTEKWKKGFIRSLPIEYKMLWFYILDDCNHAGIWDVDIEVAAIRIGADLNIEKALKLFGDKVLVFDDSNKWFISSFIEFQYGVLNQNNRPHVSVINLLIKHDLIDSVKYQHAHKLGNSIKGRQRSKVFVRDDFTCAYCGIQYDPAFLEPDHIVPLTNGGTNELTNVITSCSKCNRNKQSKTVELFCSEQGYELETVLNRIRKISLLAPSQGASQGASQGPKDKEKDKAKAKTKSKDKSYSESVERIWKQTPRMGKQRSSKKQLQDAWDAISPKPDIETVLSSLGDYCKTEDWTKDNGQWVKGIHLWVKAKKWEVEIDLSQPSYSTQYDGLTAAQRHTKNNAAILDNIERQRGGK